MNGLGKTAKKNPEMTLRSSNSKSIFEALRTLRGTSIYCMIKKAQGGSIYEELRVMRTNTNAKGKPGSLLQKDWKRDS